MPFISLGSFAPTSARSLRLSAVDKYALAASVVVMTFETSYP